MSFVSGRVFRFGWIGMLLVTACGGDGGRSGSSGLGNDAGAPGSAGEANGHPSSQATGGASASEGGAPALVAGAPASGALEAGGQAGETAQVLAGGSGDQGQAGDEGVSSGGSSGDSSGAPVAAGQGGQGSPGPGGAGGTPDEPSQPCESPQACGHVLAGGLTLAKVSLFQSVEIPLMRDGADVSSRNAPVVQGKDALLRIHVQRATDFEPRSVKAVVQIVSSAGVVRLIEVRSPAGDSTDADLSSTFNATIPGELLVGDATYRVWLAETDDVARSGETAEAVYPATAPAPLGELPSNGLQLVIVPMRYNADGSGRLPDTSVEQIDRIRRRFLQLYPVTDQGLSITVGDPWDLDASIALGCGSASWSDLLDTMYAVEDSYGALDYTYVYGMVAPAETDLEYLGTVAEGEHCISGIASAPWEPGGLTIPVSAGLSDPVTVVHELGHNHGRLHAPCGSVAMPDEAYPYAGGLIGTWGYDSYSQQLLDPSVSADFMSYCDDNAWVSDYNYQGMFDWISNPNVLGWYMIGMPAMWQTFVIDGDGRAHLGVTHRVLAPGLPPVSVEWFDGAGISLGSVTGTLTRMDNVPGGILDVPSYPENARSVRVDGGEAVLLE